MGEEEKKKGGRVRVEWETKGVRDRRTEEGERRKGVMTRPVCLLVGLVRKLRSYPLDERWRKLKRNFKPDPDFGFRIL